MFTACTTTPEYMAEVQQEQAPQEQKTEEKSDSGTNTWLWWVLGAVAIGLLAGSSSSSEQCVAVFNSDGTYRPGGCDE